MFVTALLSAATLAVGPTTASPAKAAAPSPNAVVSAYVTRLARASGTEVAAPSVSIPGLNAPLPKPTGFDAKATFNSVCAMCHGQDGKGNGPAATALNPKPANFTDPTFWKTTPDSVLFKAIKDGAASIGKSPLMTAWGGSYSDADIRALVAYIKTAFRPSDAAPAS